MEWLEECMESKPIEEKKAIFFVVEWSEIFIKDVQLQTRCITTGIVRPKSGVAAKAFIGSCW